MTKNNKAWKKILEESDILEQIKSDEYANITANEIKKISGREPRLICKIDFQENIPAALKEHKLSILATRNGNYKIAKTNPFVSIPHKIYVHDAKVFKIPKHITTLDVKNITSESKALDAAHTSKILNYVLQNKVIDLTVRGRERSNSFKFKLKSTNKYIEYDIEGVQLEIDGGYESNDNLCLIEAKMGTSNNMNIRQLLYPHLHFQNKIEKKVITYYMTYELGGIYKFTPFIVNDNNNFYLDINNTKCLLLQSNEKEELYWDNLNIVSQPKNEYPFPQANCFERIHNVLIQVIKNYPIDKETLFAGFNLVSRQHDYYVSTLEWLGLICKENKLFIPTSLGKKLLDMSERKRIHTIASIAFSNNIFKQFYKHTKPNISSQDRKDNGLTTDSTFTRRCQTINSWKKYLKEKLN